MTTGWPTIFWPCVIGLVPACNFKTGKFMFSSSSSSSSETTSCQVSERSYDRLNRFSRRTPDRRTNERRKERTNMGQSIGPTSRVGGSKNYCCKCLHWRFVVCCIFNENLLSLMWLRFLVLPAYITIIKGYQELLTIWPRHHPPHVMWKYLDIL